MPLNIANHCLVHRDLKATISKPAQITVPAKGTKARHIFTYKHLRNYCPPNFPRRETRRCIKHRHNCYCSDSWRQIKAPTG